MRELPRLRCLYRPQLPILLDAVLLYVVLAHKARTLVPRRGFDPLSSG